MSANVAVVGATGAVGELIRKVLAEREFPTKSIKFLASAKSAGKSISFRGRDYPVEELRPEAFQGVDIVLSSTPSGVSREFSPIAARCGAIVVDNSSAWRMDPDVPLVVPEVNADQLVNIKKGIIANPNCVAIPLTVALAPLHRLARLKRVVVSTYQSSSGKGAKGLADLDAQLAAVGQGREVPASQAHKARLASNVIPHDWSIGDDGFSEEETKVVHETKKILSCEVPVVATCARVPVRISHSIAVAAEFDRPIEVDQACNALSAAPGIVLCDAPPMPIDVEGQDEVFVGRVRRDPTVPHGLMLWIVADNLRKGAATNAVQIAQAIVKLRA